VTVLVLLTGERHRVAAVEPDPRIVWTSCGERIALIGSPPDPTSAYQRAVFPLAFHPTRCVRCPR
jgi:hypothetical protein